MSKEFFERLRNRALDNTSLGYEFADGVDATIEALKEMMVGEPIEAFLRHRRVKPDLPHTFLDNPNIRDPAYEEALWEGKRGTDGEGVAILAVRLS